MEDPVKFSSHCPLIVDKKVVKNVILRSCFASWILHIRCFNYFRSSCNFRIAERFYLAWATFLQPRGCLSVWSKLTESRWRRAARKLSVSYLHNNCRIILSGFVFLDPYLRILMFNQSGRLIKKKKTTVASNTKDPVFNETLNFEVSAHQLESARFLITLSSRRPEVDTMEDISLQDSEEQDNNQLYFERFGNMSLILCQRYFVQW